MAYQVLKQAEYIQSFQRAAEDEEQAELAEMGLGDFLDQIEGCETESNT